MNTFPIRSPWEQLVSRRVCSSADMSISNESRKHKFITSVPRLDSTAERQLNQQLEFAAFRTLHHQHVIYLPVCKLDCVKYPTSLKPQSESCHSVGRGQ